MAEQAFDLAGEGFLGEYDKIRGHIRQEVTRQNLALWLPPGGGLRVLDFGGGDGRDTIWLAGLGHQVTLLDESSRMTELAAEAIEEAGIPGPAQPAVVKGGLEKVSGQTFDVILSHGVLMYELDDPVGQLQGLADRLAAGGILSLLTKGYAAARQQVTDPAARVRFEATGEYVNRRNLPARAYKLDQLTNMLGGVGLEPIAEYGVRIFSDGDDRLIEDVKSRELESIVAMETEAGRNAELVEQAQMLHVIAGRITSGRTKML